MNNSSYNEENKLNQSAHYTFCYNKEELKRLHGKTVKL